MADHFATKCDVLNRGCSGYTTDLALSVAFEWAFSGLAEQPLFVVVCFGANDAALLSSVQHVPLDRYQSNLTALVGRLRAKWPGLEIVLVSPPPLDDAKWAAHVLATYGSSEPSRLSRVTRQYRDAAAAVAEAERVSFCDLWDKRFEAPGLLSDGLHLTAAGNLVLFGLVMERVSKAALEVPPSFPYWGHLLAARP